jgi:hypothetical protein
MVSALFGIFLALAAADPGLLRHRLEIGGLSQSDWELLPWFAIPLAGLSAVFMLRAELRARLSAFAVAIAIGYVALAALEGSFVVSEVASNVARIAMLAGPIALAALVVGRAWFGSRNE